MPIGFRELTKFLHPSKFTQLDLAVGKVVNRNAPERVKVAVQLNRFNPYIKMYFPESRNLYVSDLGDTTLLGDIVLIKKLDKPRRNVETHEIKDIIYTIGHIVDPLTGLRVTKEEYLECKLDSEELKQMRDSMKDREIAYEYSTETRRHIPLLYPKRFPKPDS